MKFAKSSLFLALFGGLSFSALADVDLYGKANVTVQSSDEDDESFTEVKSNASRIGFQGSEKLREGLEAVYKFEFQVNVSDDSKDTFTSRNQYVGLQGSFGQLVIGRNDTALKQSQGKLDLFNDLEGDIKNLFKGDNRLSDTVTYSSNDFNGLKVLATYVAEKDSEGENGYSLALTYGDSGLKKSKLYASIAADSEVNGYDVIRASLQGKVADIKLGAMYQKQEKVDGTGEADGYLVNAAYTLNSNTFKLQYQTIDFKDGDNNSAISVGVDHKFTKNIKLFGFYSTYDLESDVDQDYIALGMEYKF
ncbi:MULTISPECIES: porin [unclassified Pseudoalteromonas]|uniref:porin n=1 Tax=unclassified Pseudoalteromonas TaxID=194690 RepID=UPI000B3C74DC|nr:MULTISPECIES: porin [unclassified Pseudoalteromonas]MDN3379663.1 porin [Pseudoalteromonas sp. APC 3893]MDN3388003.1 porin [Pseudoalteromonas sp. APC 4017]OUS74239.1 porin [Pseudoalteromonas sp. A601]